MLAEAVEKDILIYLGEWDFDDIPIFAEEETYVVGDKFKYEGKTWIVIQNWFNSEDFLNPDGTINYNYVRPYGPVSEDTDEYRSFNTYAVGDLVWHEYEGINYQWKAVNYGAFNGTVPGEGVGWDRLDAQWFKYNYYIKGDIVSFTANGVSYEWQANNPGSGKTPGVNSEWNRLGDEWFTYNIYNTNDIVTYLGNRYRAKWYTAGDLPTSGGPWELLGPV